MKDENSVPLPGFRDLLRVLMEQEGVSFPEALRALVDIEGEALEGEANAVAAEFWTECDQAKKHEPRSMQARYALQVRRRSAGVSIRWALMGFTGPKNARKRSDRYLSRGRRSAYLLAAFKKAQDWERPIIASCEERFGPIRARSGMLGRLAQTATAYAALVAASAAIEVEGDLDL